MHRDRVDSLGSKGLDHPVGGPLHWRNASMFRGPAGGVRRVLTRPANDPPTRSGLAGFWRSRLRRSILALPLVAIAVLVTVAINESSHQRASHALARLEQRTDAQARLNSLLRQLLDAETGQRGYLLTGRPNYLVPYDRAVAEVSVQLEWLSAHYAGDPVAGPLATELTALSRAKLAELASTRVEFDAGHAASWRAQVNSDASRGHMARARRLTQQLGELEGLRVQSDRTALLDTLRTSRFGVNATAAVGVLALMLVLQKTAAIDAIGRRRTLALQLERDRLEHEASQRAEDLTELAKHLQTVHEDECGRLARDLHDELGALLTATKLDVARLRYNLASDSQEVLARLAHLNASIDGGIALKRRIIEDLRPSALTNLGLVASLEILGQDFAERAALPVHAALQEVPLSEEAQITVYRLVQEALTNIAKYARANEVRLTLEARGDAAWVEVRDDGRGFDPAQSRGSAHGLMGMRYRVEAVGGRLAVHSAPGQGTRIEASLPSVRPAPSADAAAAEEGA
jgi:signal transduction histidine kinase